MSFKLEININLPFPHYDPTHNSKFILMLVHHGSVLSISNVQSFARTSHGELLPWCHVEQSYCWVEKQKNCCGHDCGLSDYRNVYIHRWFWTIRTWQTDNYPSIGEKTFRPGRNESFRLPYGRIWNLKNHLGNYPFVSFLQYAWKTLLVIALQRMY